MWQQLCAGVWVAARKVCMCVWGGGGRAHATHTAATLQLQQLGSSGLCVWQQWQHADTVSADTVSEHTAVTLQLPTAWQQWPLCAAAVAAVAAMQIQ